MCAGLELSINSGTPPLPPQTPPDARNPSHLYFGSSMAARDARICINVRPYDRQRCDMQKRNSISSPAPTHAETQLHIVASAKTCTDVTPYRMRITPGARTCKNVSLYRRRRCNMQKRKSISPPALKHAETHLHIAAGAKTCINVTPDLIGCRHKHGQQLLFYE